jgi:TRAP-type C4-dicarboxylate transport system permease small subunit
MKSVRKILKTTSDVFGAVAILFLAFLMFGITADVAARAITGDSISGVFEMSELSLVMVVFLGTMWAQSDRAHIRVNILTEKLSGLPHRIAMAFSWGCGALALCMFAWPTTQEAIYSVSIWEFRWGYTQVPIWWTKVGVAIGLWFAAVQMTFQAVTALLEDEAEETSSVAKV